MSKIKKFSHIPYKEIGNGVLSSGVFLSSYFLGGYTLGMSIIFGGICYAGYRLFFGTDLSKEDLWKDMDGLAAQHALEQLTKARDYMAEIQKINKDIPSRNLTIKLDKLEEIGQDIILLFEQDPKELRRSRRFIDVYLSGAVSVSRQFATLHARTDDVEVYMQYREFLNEMINAFDKHYHALLDDDRVSLDVEIEVLKKRLKTEAY